MQRSDSQQANPLPQLSSAMETSKLFARRRQRIAEYYEQVDRQVDPRQALLDTTEADTLLIQSYLAEAVHCELQGTAGSLEALERSLPLIGAHGQLTKLVVAMEKLKRPDLQPHSETVQSEVMPG